MARRKRIWTWRPWRPGLALELTDYQGMTCPWLSRTAGVPVLRPDAYAGAVRRLGDVTMKIAAAFEPFTLSMKQAADALGAFNLALSRRPKIGAGVTWTNEHGDPLS
jgi:hypothetical protein